MSVMKAIEKKNFPAVAEVLLKLLWGLCAMVISFVMFACLFYCATIFLAEFYIFIPFDFSHVVAGWGLLLCFSIFFSSFTIHKLIQ